MKYKDITLKPCGCGKFIPYVEETYFIVKSLKTSTTIKCINCRKKVTRFTRRGATDAWNRMVTDGK